jgi:hypothetical protein
LICFIAEKLKLNDAALILGTLDEVGVLDVPDGLLLPQAAASRAAHAATAESANVLFALNTNETTSIVRARHACTNGTLRI